MWIVFALFFFVGCLEVYPVQTIVVTTAFVAVNIYEIKRDRDRARDVIPNTDLRQFLQDRNS